jgi:hypothetical protein
VRRLSKSILNLLKGILNITSFLVGLFIKIAANIGLLLLDLASKSFSETLTNNINQALLICGLYVGTDDFIPALKLVKPLLGFFKTSELRLEILLKAELSKVMNVSALFDLLDFSHLRIEVSLNLGCDGLF